MNIFDTIGRTVVSRYTNKGLRTLERQGIGGCFNALSRISVVVLALLVAISWCNFNRKKKNEIANQDVWSKVKVGDSLFVSKDVSLVFYKMGRLSLNYDKKTDSNINDSINFFPQNRLGYDYTQKFETSFIGICAGKDSTKTIEGEDTFHHWIEIVPFKELTKKQKTGTSKPNLNWEDSQKDVNSTAVLSRCFYVKLSDVSLYQN